MAEDESSKGLPKNALYRRWEQLQRWKDSPTDKEPEETRRPEKRVKFNDGCMFLAACSCGDIDEVESFLDRGADINTSNIDGLTALHQACIDKNITMVEFLVQRCADVNVCDNEGWTPLHATASCGFTEIARFLISSGADVASVNNDGDLPTDICEDEEMEKLLLEYMDKQGIDADAARRAEEEMMLTDANQWLNSRNMREKPHSQTGATSLHVASAKGYIKVMKILIQAGANLNAQDVDGWTPLHAAAHWGQEDACKLLSEHFCDMETKNYSGQAPLDVADEDMFGLLEELKKRQATLRDTADLQGDLIENKAPHKLQRRSSVTRMSVNEKQSVTLKTAEQEKAVFSAEEDLGKRVDGEPEIPTTEMEKNALNKQSSETEVAVLNSTVSQPEPIITTTTTTTQASPSSSATTTATDAITTTNLTTDLSATTTPSLIPPVPGSKRAPAVAGDDNSGGAPSESKKPAISKPTKLDPLSRLSNIIEDSINQKEDGVSLKERLKHVEGMEDEDSGSDNAFEDDADDVDEVEEDVDEDEEKDDEMEITTSSSSSASYSVKEHEVSVHTVVLGRTISAPAGLLTDKHAEVPQLTLPRHYPSLDSSESPLLWRSMGLRKIGSSSMVPETLTTSNDISIRVQRSASTPRMIAENENISGAPEKTENGTDRNNLLSDNSNRISTNQAYIPRSLYSSSSYVPYYRRQQLENERKERERADKEREEQDKSRKEREQAEKNRLDRERQERDEKAAKEEKEKLAKEERDRRDRERRERERREKEANEKEELESKMRLERGISGSVVRSSSVTADAQATTSPPHSTIFKKFEPPSRDEEAELQRKVRAKRSRETRRPTQGVTKDDVQKARDDMQKADSMSGDSNKTQKSSESDSVFSRVSEPSSRLTDPVTSRLPPSGKTAESGRLDDAPSIRRPRTWEDRKDDESRTSTRRSRIPELSNSTSSIPSLDSDSNSRTALYTPGLRNSLDTVDTSSSESSIPNSAIVTRSSSLRRQRLSDIENKEEEKIDDKKDDKKDESKEHEPKQSSAIRARRKRSERHPTGICDPNNPEGTNEKSEPGTEEKKEIDKKENKENKPDTSYLRSRYRPSSFTELSKSTSSLDVDYKKLYEDERTESDRLRKDLEQTKRELEQAQREIDRAMRKKESDSKQEKRSLERKVSELEEELKKIKEDNDRVKQENQALIRVISRLSR